MSGYAHPGSIQVAVGECDAMIRLNIEQSDLAGIAKFCRLLKGTVSVYAEDEPEIWEKVQAIPAFTWEKSEFAAFEDEMQRRELCLLILRKKNMFGYQGEPALGNADVLSEAMA